MDLIIYCGFLILILKGICEHIEDTRAMRDYGKRPD